MYRPLWLFLGKPLTITHPPHLSPLSFCVHAHMHIIVSLIAIHTLLFFGDCLLCENPSLYMSYYYGWSDTCTNLYSHIRCCATFIAVDAIVIFDSCIEDDRPG